MGIKGTPTIDEILASGISGATGYLSQIKTFPNATGFFGEANAVIDQISTIINAVSTILTLGDVAIESANQVLEVTKTGYESVKESYKQHFQKPIATVISKPPNVAYYQKIRERLMDLRSSTAEVVGEVQGYIDTINSYLSIIQTALNALQNLQGIITLMMSYVMPAGAWIAAQIEESRTPGSNNTLGDYFSFISDVWSAISDIDSAVSAMINNFESLGNVVTNSTNMIEDMFDHSNKDDRAESYDGPIGSAEIPGSITNTQHPVTTIDGLGFIWNPESAFNGKLLITLPVTNKTTCSVYAAVKNYANKWVKGDLLETGKYIGETEKGTRYSFQKRGGKYNNGEEVYAVGGDKEWLITDPALKYN